MEILNERERTHGAFANVAQTAQHLRDLWRSAPNWERLTATQRETLDMKAVKLSRILHGDPNEIDHWRDDSGYSELIVRELLARGTAQVSVSARTYPSTTLSDTAIANIAGRYGLNGGADA